MTIKIKESKGFIIFIVFFMMYYIPRFIEYTMIVEFDVINSLVGLVKNMSYLGTLICVGIRLVARPIISLDKQRLIRAAVFLFFTYQAFVKDRNSVFVVLCLGMLYQKSYQRSFLKSVLIVSSFMFIMTIALSVCGLIPDVLTDFNKLGISTYRHSLGFIYAGQLIMQFVPIVFVYYYLNSSHINFVDNLFWISLATLLFIFSKTIMGYMIILVFIFLFNLIKKNRFRSFKTISENNIYRYMPYLACILTFVMMYLYRAGVGIISIIDSIMNNRVKLGTVFWDIYGIKLFGTAFQNDMRYYYQVLDSDYMYFLISCGIIYTILSMWIVKKIMDSVIKKGDIFLYCIWLILTVNSIANNGLFSLVMNPFVIDAFASIGQNYCNKNCLPIFPKKRLFGKLRFIK